MKRNTLYVVVTLAVAAGLIAIKPHVRMQGIVPQFDDGCVVLKGRIAGERAVAISLA